MQDTPLFLNRIDAGKAIAQAVNQLFSQEIIGCSSPPIPIVYALPRGGIPVAVPVAKALYCSLDIVVAKKISYPEHPELAIGAVNIYGDVIWVKNDHQSWTRNLGKSWTKNKFFNDTKNLCSSESISLRKAKAMSAAIEKAKSLERQLSCACPQIDTKDAIMILVDDGIATGMTILVAIRALKKLLPAQIWLCSPIAPSRLLPCLNQYVDRLIILKAPEKFASVSEFYVNFHQVETGEALQYLREVNG